MAALEAATHLARVDAPMRVLRLSKSA